MSFRTGKKGVNRIRTVNNETLNIDNIVDGEFLQRSGSDIVSSASVATNIYNADGIINANRTATHNGNDLIFDNTAGGIFQSGSIGTNCVMLNDPANFLGSGNPGVGFACFPSPTETLFNAVGDFGTGDIASLQYDNSGAGGKRNQLTASSSITYISSENPVGGRNENIFMDADQVNPFAGQGQITLTTEALVFSKPIPTNNANTGILSRNAVNGVIEIVDKATIGGGVVPLLGPFIVTTPATTLSGIVTNITGATIPDNSFYHIEIQIGNNQTGSNTDHLIEEFEITGEKTAGVNSFASGPQLVKTISSTGSLAPNPGNLPVPQLADDTLGGVDIRINNLSAVSVDSKFYYKIYLW